MQYGIGGKTVRDLKKQKKQFPLLRFLIQEE
jgi:hypothetical protein